MTAYSITVSSPMRFLGLAPTDKWNAYAWNAFKWGEGTAPIDWDFTHVISSSFSPLSAMAFNVVHLISNDLTFSAGDAENITAYVSGGVFVMTSETTSEVLRDGQGYLYVFPDRVTDGENRSFTSWTSGTTTSVTWSTAAAAATTWS
jgi:hypothetical protein